MTTHEKRSWAIRLLQESANFWRRQHDDPIRCFLACDQVADLVNEYEGKPVVKDPTLPPWMALPQPAISMPSSHEKGLHELGLID